MKIQTLLNFNVFNGQIGIAFAKDEDYSDEPSHF